jgi:hypothetical protein
VRVPPQPPQWPARNPPGVVVRRENAFVMPAAFSPIR